jgi:[acyl-carrier-protein] S-malonyltransferase
MGKVAFLFPGQGAQAVGMGKDLYQAISASRQIFDLACEILEFDIRNLCFEGPQETLNRTEISQPAILVSSVAALAALKERGRGIVFEAAAGLSLGEYTALVAAGALRFEDALRLVQKRGRYMQEACDAQPSGMASVIGLPREKVRQACEAAKGAGVICMANMNAPGQVAISGDVKALEVAMQKARELGAKRVVPLRVAGAFHSPLMDPAAEKLKVELQKTDFSAAQVPVVANVTAGYVTRAEDIREALARQVNNPVLWEDSMNKLLADGFDTFYEIGPGRVLAGILRRMAPKVAIYNLRNLDDLKALSG